MHVPASEHHETECLVKDAPHATRSCISYCFLQFKGVGNSSIVENNNLCMHVGLYQRNFRPV